MKKLAQITKKLAKSKPNIKFVDTKVIHKDGFEDIDIRIPNIDLLNKSISWKPKINIEKGMLKLINSLKKR